MLKNLVGTLGLFLMLATQGLAQSSDAQVFRVTPTSMAIISDQARIFIDPVGLQSQYSQFGRPDIVVLTRADPDYLSTETMIGMLRRDTIVLAPQSVIDELPLMISNNVITPFEIGGTQQVEGITFTAFGSVEMPTGNAQEIERPRGDIIVVVEIDGRSLVF